MKYWDWHFGARTGLSSGGEALMSIRLVVRCVTLSLVTLLVTSLSVGATSSASNPTNRLAKIPIPGKPLKSFDISWVDAATGRYYLGDRSNASIDVVDVTTNEVVTQIGGFVGFRGSNDTSGPDGVVVT